MSAARPVRTASAWLWLAAALCIFGLVFAGLVQHSGATAAAAARADAQRDLDLLRLSLQGALRHPQQRGAQDIVAAWGASDNLAAQIALTGPGGATLALFRRPGVIDQPLNLSVSIDAIEGGPARLDLAVDLAPARARQQRFARQLFALYLLAGGAAAGLIGAERQRRRAVGGLRQATEELDHYFTHGLDLFCIGDRAGRLLRVNPRWESTIGYPVGEIAGRPLLDFVDAADAAATGAMLARVAAQEPVTAFTNHLRHRCGALRSLEWAIQPRGAIFFATARDVTEREQREAEIAFLNRIYSTLSETNQLIVRCPGEAALFDNICRIAVEFGGMKLAWIGREDAATQRIVPAAVHGAASGYLDGIVVSARADVPEGRGPTGRALREGAAQFVNDYATHPDLEPWKERGRRFGWGSSGALPVRRHGRPYVVLTFYDDQPHAFSEEVMRLLNEMAVDIEYALARFDLEAHRRHSDEELRIAAIAFESQDAMMVTDADGAILRVNAAFTRITGYTQDDVLGRNPSMLQSGRHPASFYAEMWERVRSHGNWQGEVWDRRKNGVIFPKWLTISSVRDPHGRITHHVATFSDTSERKAAAAAISRLAYYDPLTTLPNRQLMMDRLKQAIRTGARTGAYGAVLFLDLDNFKTVNDTLGHDEGDKLLGEAARRLRAGVREEDTVSRFGGDEFVILLENLDGPRERAAVQAKGISDKLLVALAQPYRLRDKDHACSASIGVAMWRGGPLIDEHELLKRSDLAMYEAKKAGRNAVRFFDPVMQSTLEARARLEGRLRLALSLGQLQLHLQRQVDERGQVLGAESLLRWHDPERGLVAPGEFIALAEESDLIIGIGQWVLQAACRQLQAWSRDPATRRLQLSVNISPKQFAEDLFVAEVAAVLAQSHADPHRLQLEITEGMLLDNVEETIAKMTELRRLGVSFALDDFGTGYSSLAYLHRLPLNMLKIDQSFVRQMGAGSPGEAIVRTIIQMGQSLGLEVLAEGVETEAQRLQLARLGCTRFQGHLFGRPAAIDQFHAALARDGNPD